MADKIEVESILDTVTKELQELSNDIDFATTKLDEEFHISEKLHDLSQDLDKATSIINSEFQSFSEKLSTEFSNLVNKLNSELNQITIKINTADEKNTFANIGLTAAVKQSGITAMKSDKSS